MPCCCSIPEVLGKSCSINAAGWRDLISMLNRCFLTDCVVCWLRAKRIWSITSLTFNVFLGGGFDALHVNCSVEEYYHLSSVCFCIYTSAGLSHREAVWEWRDQWRSGWLQRIPTSALQARTRLLLQQDQFGIMDGVVLFPSKTVV